MKDLPADFLDPFPWSWIERGRFVPEVFVNGPFGRPEDPVDVFHRERLIFQDGAVQDEPGDHVQRCPERRVEVVLVHCLISSDGRA